MPQLLIRIIYLVVALGVPYTIANRLQRVYQIPYALTAVGLLTASGAFVVQSILTLLADGPLLDTPFFGALILALIIGFTDGLVRFFGYYAIARSTVSRPQALMIGLGHGIPLLIYQGITVVVAGGVVWAELGILLAQLVVHLAVSWVVLQTFLRNEIAWTFWAIAGVGLAFGTDAYIANTSTHLTPLVVWWGLLALIGLGLLSRIQSPLVNGDERA